MANKSGSHNRKGASARDGNKSLGLHHSRLQLAGPDDPFRDDRIERLGLDGQPSGMFSRVKMILSSHATAGIFEVCDDGNRSLYVIKSGDGWIEVELD